MCPELLQLFTRAKSGDRRLDLKSLLEEVPIFRELPARAPENNVTAVARSPLDKVHRAWQQSLLHGLRLFAYLYTGMRHCEDHKFLEIAQKFWLHQCELYTKVENHRRERTVPGSVQVHKEVLIKPEDLQAAAAANKIQARTSTFKGGKGRGQYSFRGFRGGFRFAPAPSWRPSYKGGQFGFKGMFPPLCTDVAAFGTISRRDSFGSGRATTHHFPLHETKAVISVVAGQGVRRSAKIGFGRSATQPKVPSPHVQESVHEVFGRCEESNLGSRGLRKGWGSEKSSISGYPSFGAMVRDREARTTGGYKAKAHCRLQGSKQVSSHTPISFGPLAKHLPPLKRRVLGSKGGLKGRLFSFRLGPSTSSLHPHASWPANLGVSGRLFRPERFTHDLDETDENFREDLACKGHHGFRLFGRHFGHRTFEANSSSRHYFRVANTQRFRHGCEFEKVSAPTFTGNTSFGLHHRLQTGDPRSTQRQKENFEEGAGKTHHARRFNVPKNGSHFGHSSQLFDGHPKFASLYGSSCQFRKPTVHFRLGLPPSLVPIFKSPSAGGGTVTRQICRSAVVAGGARKTLHSDSSDQAWAGVDLQNNLVVKEFWRHQIHLHINQKELLAAVNTVKSLAKPKDNVLLTVDNQVTYWYLRKKGGRLETFNAILRPFLHWCLENKIHLELQWVPSAQMVADKYTRLGLDRGTKP